MKRLAIVLLSLWPAASSGAEIQGFPPSRRTNVVLILADYGGYGDIGPYGARDVRTPNLDRLAREGVRLTDAYAAAPICTPSRVALMTGRYQHRLGLEGNVAPGRPDVGLSPAEPTLPRMLGSAGYATAMFGKWHLGYASQLRPAAHGFGEFFGFLDWTVDYYSHRTFDGKPGLYDGTEPVEREGYITELLTDRAVSFIERHPRSPFFLYVAYNAPLPPCQPPNRPSDVRTQETWDSSTRADYVGAVESLDDGVGRILASVDRLGLREDTLVIFSYDHGGRGLSRNAPLFHGFATLWEGGVRVPCILRWPRRLPRGKVSSQVAVSMDLTATILDAAGVSPSPAKALDGVSLLPILDGQGAEVERTLYWRLDLPFRKQKAVRKGKWKYMLDGNTQMLFDLENDVGERDDVAYRFRDVVRELSGLLGDWEKGLPHPPPRP